MDLTHSFTVPAPVETSWAHLMDIAAVAECFPGATVTEVSEDGFSGTVKVKLGPIALLYAGSGTFVARDDATHTATIRANGKDRRGNGTAGATVAVALAGSADGTGTTVDVTTDLNVTGKPAQFGRGVMQDVSDKLLGQFVACLEQRLAAEAPVAAPPVHEPAGPVHESDPIGQSHAGGAGSPGSGPVHESDPIGQSDAGGAGSPGSGPVHESDPIGQSDAGARRPAPADDALDLGAAVVPVLLKSAAPQLIAGLIGLVIGVLIGRRRSG